MEEVSLRVEKKLRKLGVNISKVPEFLLEWMKRIETYVVEQENNYYEGVQLIKGAKISIKAIADNLGCSRTTFYSYDKLLQRYVELSANEFEKKKTPLNSEKLNEKIRTLENQVQKMIVRDVEMGVLRSENKRLEARIVVLEKEKDELYGRYIHCLNNKKQQSQKIKKI